MSKHIVNFRLPKPVQQNELGSFLEMLCPLLIDLEIKQLLKKYVVKLILQFFISYHKNPLSLIALFVEANVEHLPHYSLGKSFPCKHRQFHQLLE